MAKHSTLQKKPSLGRKIVQWWDNNILKFFSLFLLIFIPLYPKFPLVDIRQTWVNIRLEDVFIALLFLIFIIQTIRRKTTLRTPLTITILLYWIIGLVSSVHAIIGLVPSAPEIFPHLVVLNYLRRIEYMLMFFIVVSTIRSIKDAKHYLLAFCIGLFGVVVYGFGQKFIGWPAFSTMNEEFAKGLALRFPPRAISTFAGHYDLSAYLVFALALLMSMAIVVRRWSVRSMLIFLTLSSYLLLLFTKSRISFGAYLLAIIAVFIMHKRKILMVPVIILSITLMFGFEGVSERFKDMFRVENVVVDLKTGQTIGTVEDYFKSLTPTPAPGTAPVEFVELPTGSAFIDVPLLAGNLTETRTTIMTTDLLLASQSAHLATASGEFLVKQAVAFDISLTTRLQGGWPRALTALRRNYYLGSGFSSISLATDNDYLRSLGETGIAGLLAFCSILFMFAVTSKRFLSIKQIPFSKGMVIGVGAGVFGLVINAVLIDVFEASKVAYVLWIFVGVVLGLYAISPKPKHAISEDVKDILKSHTFVLFLLIITVVVVFYNTLAYKFTADDYTWLRWMSGWSYENIPGFFANAEGFFYRPFIKTMLTLLYPIFGKQEVSMYHFMSLLIYTATSFVVYLTVRKITNKWVAGIVSGLLFIIHPIHAPNVLWMSGLSSLFGGAFYIGSLYAFVLFDTDISRTRRIFWYGVSCIMFALSLFSYEMSITLPLLLTFYMLLCSARCTGKLLKKVKSLIFSTIAFYVLAIGYLILRNAVAKAVWMSGDYSYDRANALFNTVGNLLGYCSEMIVGHNAIPYYDSLRIYFQANHSYAGGGIFLAIAAITIIIFILRKKRYTLRTPLFFFILWIPITLLPALPLGNIAERYAYVSSIGYTALVGILVAWLFSKSVIYKLVAASICVVLFSFYLIQFNHVKSTWEEAGQTANIILRAIPTKYKEFPSFTSLYFVKLPLRIERAWVFPTGLEDGLWLIYKNPTLMVFTENDLDAALDIKDSRPNTYVFVYENGQLKEATRMTVEVPIQKK